MTAILSLLGLDNEIGVAPEFCNEGVTCTGTRAGYCPHVNPKLHETMPFAYVL
jgi:hypothetical protein